MSKEEDETERQLNSNPIRRRSRSRTMESRPRYFLEGGKWRDATCHERRGAIMCQLPEKGVPENLDTSISGIK